MPKGKFKVNGIELNSAELNRIIDKAMKEAAEKMEADQLRKWQPKSEKIGVCTCGGEIRLTTSFIETFNDMFGPLIIGPGSRSQFTKTKQEHCCCQKCGLVYNKKFIEK